MTEPIVSRDTIAQQATAAAERCVQTGVQQSNEYPAGSEAAAEWTTRYAIALRRLTVPAEVEGGA